MTNRRAVEAIAADAYHVDASIQLKFGNEGPAWMVADASIRAAERSEDPVFIACSARIVTHALMDGHHFGEAKDVAGRMSRRLASSWIPVAERRAALLVDLARAYALWGRHGHAYEALRSAGAHAPEELTGRRDLHPLIREVATNAPSGTRRAANDWAKSLGVLA